MNNLKFYRKFGDSNKWCNRISTMIIAAFISFILGGYLGYLAYINRWLG